MHWTDNELTIDWERVAEGVRALRERVQQLYHSGIDRSKVAQWAAAHDLVAAYVPPAEGSRWAREARDLPEVDERSSSSTWSRTTSFPSASSTPR